MNRDKYDPNNVFQSSNVTMNQSSMRNASNNSPVNNMFASPIYKTSPYQGNLSMDSNNSGNDGQIYGDATIMHSNRRVNRRNM